jgi:hypothetical protein
LFLGNSSGGGAERSYFGNPPFGKASAATALGAPPGEGNAAGGILAFRIGGSGAHNDAFAEHTEANVHDGTASRLIRMPLRSRDTFAVWPRFKS